MLKTKIDYLTISLGQHKTKGVISTFDVLNIFASILPETFRKTCRDVLSSAGTTNRVVQCGISVSLQYGTALQRGWVYSVQLSGDYWHAIERNKDAVIHLLGEFEGWRISRLDIESTAVVPIEDWRGFCKSAFEKGLFVTGKEDERTVYIGSRKSQFYTRIYNKSAENPKYFPAPDGMVQIRLELEIHRVKEELVLQPAFLNSQFADRLYIQKVRCVAINDDTGFVQEHFDSGEKFEKIKTIKRTLGDMEKTVDYIFKAYAPYISAVMNSQLVADRYKGIEVLDEKGKKVLAILDNGLEDYMKK
ncbi:MAG: replication initiation factor domain-containing protein [Oscillospiraceae bacterium]|nr:replication initiation factor domain-containing protein [Oscillospiraceae bacterium]